MGSCNFERSAIEPTDAGTLCTVLWESVSFAGQRMMLVTFFEIFVGKMILGIDLCIFFVSNF